MNNSEILKKAFECLENDEPFEAIDTFNSVPATDPCYGEAMLECGTVHLNIDEPDEAIECFDKIPVGDKNYDEGLIRKAYIYRFELQDYDKAVETYSLVSEQSHLYMDVLMMTVACLSANGKFEEAIECSKKIPKSYERYGEVIFSIAFSYDKQNQNEKALEMYSSIDVKDKAFGKAMVSKSMLYEKLGDIDNALLTLSQIPETSDMYVRSFKDRTAILKEKGRESEILKHFDGIQSSANGYSSLMIMKACELANLKRFEEAIQWLEDTVKEEHNEEYIEALRFIRSFYKDLGNSEKSEEYRIKANELERQWFIEGRVSSAMEC